MKLQWSFFSLFLASLDSRNAFFVNGFQNNFQVRVTHHGMSKPTFLSMKNDPNNPYNIAAQQMKNMKPEDFDRMIKELDTMNPVQRTALKAMGMDPEMMKKTMEMMKKNPSMMQSAQKLMENMTPEQLMEQSKMAQQRMANMSPEDLEKMNAAVSQIPQEQLDQAVTILSQQTGSTASRNDGSTSVASGIATGPGTSSDPAVIDAMFKVGELLSDPPTGGCSFAGFAAVPIIQLLKGDRDMDLSPAELKECWANGSLGATRVDRAGFERVWKEVQDYFEDDIMGEARKEARKLVSKKGSSSTTSNKPPSSSVETPTTTVGSNLSSEQLAAVNERVKNLSADEMDSMLGMMENMDAAQEERMKAMGVDPAMMRKTAQMMKNNPIMRQAAQKMMSSMSPEDMLRTSQQAQQQMSKMSKEEIERTIREAEEAAKSNPDQLGKLEL